MDVEPLALLGEATLAGSAALLLVLVLRRPVRAWLGASAAYALWLCVPIALLAVMLPRGADVPLGLPVAWQAVPMVTVAAIPESQPGGHWREWLLLAWLTGALASAAVLGWQQWRFRRGLGALHRRDDGLYQSAHATSGLPAVTGVLRPRILLPADFERRYTVQEQALVIAHERLHVRRGDLAANALSALLACLFWFNPLLHLALRRFRFDQELACDERVIARHPRARRSYGEAMLKTQFDPSPLPLGCHWQARHPLKERIDMLKRPTPSPLQWIVTTFLALGLSAVAGYAAWAAQPAQVRSPDAASATPAYALDMRMEVDGKESRFQIRERAGKTFAVRSDESGSPVWEGEFSLKPLRDPQTLTMVGVVRADGEVIAQPGLTFTMGRAATIQISTLDGSSTFTLEVTANPLGEDMTPGSVTFASPARPAERPAMAEMRTPPPSYPREALRHGQSGRVVAVVDVDADGMPVEVNIERSEPSGVFDAATIAAIRQWRFTPAMENGRAVPGRVRVPVDFDSGMTAVAGPSGVERAEDFRWFQLEPDKVTEAVCDVLRKDGHDPKAIAYCGIRKETANR